MMAVNESSYSAVFGLLGKILYKYPDKAFYKEIDDEKLFDDIPLESSNENIKTAEKLLHNFHADNDKEKYDKIVSDYQDLFVGVNGVVKAPVWESIYTSCEPIMFQRSTLDARQWYARFGLKIEKLYNEPDDHAGQLLMFFAYLLSNESAKKEADEFFKTHINNWLNEFADNIIKSAETDFFRGTAYLLKGTIEDYSQQ